MRIWKYELGPGEQQIEMPRNAVPMSVGVQGGSPVLWVGFSVAEFIGIEMVVRVVYVAMTGEEFEPFDWNFVGTVQLPNGIVCHVFMNNPQGE